MRSSLIPGLLLASSLCMASFALGACSSFAPSNSDSANAQPPTPSGGSHAAPSSGGRADVTLQGGSSARTSGGSQSGGSQSGGSQSGGTGSLGLGGTHAGTASGGTSSDHSPQTGGSVTKPGGVSSINSALSARPGRKFREVLGVNTKFAQGESAQDLALLSDLGLRWVRDTVAWSVLEPTPGKFGDFPADFQERLAFYKAHDIGLVFMLAYDDWIAYPYSDADPGAGFQPVPFGNYARTVAERLSQSGVRFVLELWNEPHNFVLRPRLGGAWNGALPSPWVDRYVSMVKEAVQRVKDFDPKIKLLSDDDMWVIHYWFLEAGLPANLDGFAVHPYVITHPERAAISADTQWMQPFVGVDADGSFTSAMRRLRDHGENKLGHRPEMWLTEWGWPIDTQLSDGSSLSEDTVSNWLPRALVLAEAAGAESVCWFSLQDSVDGPMGLTRNDGSRRKSYRTFKALSDELGDYEYVEQLAGKDTPTQGAQAFLFRRGESAKLVAWSVEPSRGRITLRGALANATVKDSLAQPLSPQDGTLALGSAPIFIELSGAAAATDVSSLIDSQ